MTKRNERNERVKRRYFAYLTEAQRYSEKSVDVVAAAIAKFEIYNRYRDFGTFHQEQAIAFKRWLAQQYNNRTKERLSKSTIRSTLAALKSFFHWLASCPGYRSKLTYSDADYFNPSDRDSRIALAQRPRPVPSLQQIQHALNLMPIETVLDRRDRALVAFIALTGCRDRAVVSLKLRHIDPAAGIVFQDAREVETKFGKTMTTYFFPIGEIPRQLVVDWVDELVGRHLWGPGDPLFPATLVGRGSAEHFCAQGLLRKHWSNADPVRRIFRKAFERSGQEYFNPHSFRHTLARLGQKKCRTPEEMKAWSQNLGHEQMLTTFTSYGRIDDYRQGELIQALQ